jgi:hypothetical protein
MDALEGQSIKFSTQRKSGNHLSPQTLLGNFVDPILHGK